MNPTRPNPALTIDSLDDSDRNELSRLPSGDSFEASLYRWARDIISLECKEGYAGIQDDYNFTLWNRDSLEASIAHASPTLALKLKAAVAPFDERFRAATRQHTDPNVLDAPYGGEPRYPGFPRWWWSRWAAKTDRRTPRQRRDDHKSGKVYRGEAVMDKDDNVIVERLIPIVRTMAESGERPSTILHRIKSEAGDRDGWPISYWVWRRAFDINTYFADKSYLWVGFGEGGTVEDAEIDGVLGPSISAYIRGLPPPEPPAEVT